MNINNSTLSSRARTLYSIIISNTLNICSSAHYQGFIQWRGRVGEVLYPPKYSTSPPKCCEIVHVQQNARNILKFCLNQLLADKVSRQITLYHTIHSTLYYILCIPPSSPPRNPDYYWIVLTVHVQCSILVEKLHTINHLEQEFSSEQQYPVNPSTSEPTRDGSTLPSQSHRYNLRKGGQETCWVRGKESGSVPFKPNRVVLGASCRDSESIPQGIL